MAKRINLDDYFYCAECGEMVRWDESERGENKDYEVVRMCYNCYEEAIQIRRQKENEQLKTENI